MFLGTVPPEEDWRDEFKSIDDRTFVQSLARALVLYWRPDIPLENPFSRFGRIGCCLALIRMYGTGKHRAETSG